MKTSRGFELQHFIDDYGVECSLQESSSCEPHVWLGVHKPKIMIQWIDAKNEGLDLKKDYPETGDCGWCTISIPEKTLIESRMHLNKRQAKELARKLNYFARTGKLKEEI